jgi:hypothetical protein
MKTAGGGFATGSSLLDFHRFVRFLGGHGNRLRDMKFPLFYSALICAGLMATPAHSSGEPAAPPAATGPLGPRMTFATNEYHFGRVIVGEQVKYVFILTNTGDQTLVISNVQPGCHCTTAGGWTHQIEPGKTGEIPIKFDSGGLRGGVRRTILVTSNDKLAPMQNLALEGTIWRPIEVSPQFVNIVVMPDAPSNSSVVVHLTNQTSAPITLYDPTSANGRFTAVLKTTLPGKEYELTVTAVSPLAPGNTPGTIFIKTSLTNMPALNIPVIAMMQRAVSLAPMQIYLPPQIERPMTNIVTITANGSKALALSNLEVSDKRISVTLKTITPGKIFQLAAVFPAGFQLSPGQPTQVTVKSDNAEFPVITVPIRQFPRQPAVSPPPAHPRVMSQNPPPVPAAGRP